MPQSSIEQVLKDHSDQWLTIPGIEGAAIGLFDGKPCIKIFASSSRQNLQDKIPSTVEGYPVIIEETGKFRASEQ